MKPHDDYETIDLDKHYNAIMLYEIRLAELEKKVNIIMNLMRGNSLL